MLLASFRKHPSRSTADHISKSVSCGMCGAVNDHIRLKAFGGWKFDRGTTQLRARILRGKGVHKKKSSMFTGGSSTSATFVLTVRGGTGLALQRKRMGVSQNPQSTTGT